MKTNGLHEWFKDNLWAFIIVLGGFLLTFSALKSQVDANTIKIQNLSELVKRVIVLEERESHLEEDIKEIKQNIKEINRKLD